MNESSLTSGAYVSEEKNCRNKTNVEITATEERDLWRARGKGERDPWPAWSRGPQAETGEGGSHPRSSTGQRGQRMKELSLLDP